ncbi:MAG: D-alanyl-D-alanine carboxypeptidase family protein [Oculatellaceae cyanobacterium Prado106]|nr:D-alanyl-D-alanine carboxypeptidase family protein [Oculatellaceae cyanobacterium Prado106]
MTDIPEALRDAPQAKPRGTWRRPLILGLLALGAVLIVVLPALLTPRPQTSTAQTPQIAPANPANPRPTNNSPANSTASPGASPDQILGHYRYDEAPESELEPITASGDIKMRRGAAEKFQAMVNAASADGVSLVPISGFRSIEDQNHLFFDVKAERGQTASKRADVSAPPNYSEHHTGYAVDIGDAAQPGTNLSQSFETTSAFKWLQQNAAYYSFEMSFTQGNPEGVSYEPWHWRFVGDRKSLETFYRARKK